MEIHGPGAAFVFALALGAGVAGQLVAHHLRLPAIIPLLALGVSLGPDGLDWIDPRALGAGLFGIVELGVGVILFEGGMNLDLSRLRREASAIRMLVTTGAAVTALGGALAARWAMEWPWELCILFGTLVIVTGPTVIGPLLRNVRVAPRVATVLEAEGVLIDPVGAIVVAVVLQFVLGSHPDPALGALGGLAGRLVVGSAIGLGGGFALRALLRRPRLVPEGLETLVALGGALLLLVASDAVVSQTGVLAVTLAGVVVGDAPRHSGRDLRAFQEALTLGLIGVLFVLLAADVRIAEVAALGAPGVLTVALLILAVRPVNVLASTWGADLGWRDKSFLAWIAPRGIVAAAIASLVAAAMEQAGLDGGRELRALVFLTIAATVLIQGATADPVARLLGVRRPDRDMIAILGADGLALALATVLRDAGRRVVLLDANQDHCRQAQEQGFAVVFGNALDERTLARGRLEQALMAVGGTANDEANSLFARESQELFGVPARYVALNRAGSALTAPLLARQSMRVLFDAPKDLDRWSVRLRHGAAVLVRLRFEGSPPQSDEPGAGAAARARLDPFVILAIGRKDEWQPMHAEFELVKGDVCMAAVHEPETDLALAQLAALGWSPDAETGAKSAAVPG
jgi:NhaP-type Na+/H+ or K+/H+ antiporter